MGVDEAFRTSTVHKGTRGNSIDVYSVGRPIKGRAVVAKTESAEVVDSEEQPVVGKLIADDVLL